MSQTTMIEARPIPSKKRRSISWNSREGRSVIYQVVAIASVATLIWLLVRNTLRNMRERGIQSGYDFMGQPFGFDVSETMIPYDVMSTYWTAFSIGLLNTLKVAVIGIVLATILGTLIGVGRFSSNFLARKICYGYVEFFRNVPIYLQLLIWYIVFTEILPPFEDAWQAGHFYLSKGGFSFPWPVWKLGQTLALIGLLAGVAGSWMYARKASKHFDLTGQQKPVLRVSLGLIVGLALLGNLGGAGLLEGFGVSAVSKPDAPGVYVDGAKIASLGLRIRNGRSFHGLALNVDMDLEPFRRINPCGYAGMAMTQLRELAGPITLAEVRERLRGELTERLGYAEQKTLTGGIELR